MTTQEVAALDRAVARAGETITLRRTTGTTPSASFDVVLVALVRGYKPSELISGSGIVQGDSLIILSPTALDRAQWPGGQSPTTKGDVRIPRTTDAIIRQGISRTVISANPFYARGQLIRVEVQVRG
jgi:hypothetical protein